MPSRHYQSANDDSTERSRPSSGLVWRFVAQCATACTEASLRDR